jgi:hypothetical protein
MLGAAMGSKPKTEKPPPPPPPAAIPKTADAYAAGDAAILEARRRGSYGKTFLAGNPMNSSTGAPGGTSFLGG